MSISYFVDARIDDAATLDRLVRFTLDENLSLVTDADLDDSESGKIHTIRSAQDVYGLIDTMAQEDEMHLVFHEMATAFDHVNEHSIGRVGEFLRAEGFGYRIVSYDQQDVEHQRRWIPGLPYELSGQMSVDGKLLVEMDKIYKILELGTDALDAFKAYHLKADDQTFDLALGEEALAHARTKLDAMPQAPRP